MASAPQSRGDFAAGIQTSPQKIRIALANERDRQAIYRIRHDVYAAEIRQHPENSAGVLSDSLDPHNVYIAAAVGDEIAGFISITPPSSPHFSIDKYFARADLPFAWDKGIYEIRLLTVCRRRRGRQLAVLLMYAAFRWVESAGGTRIVAIGREDMLDLYFKAGLEPLGRRAQCGQVTFELLTATTQQLRERCAVLASLVMKLNRATNWQLEVPFFPAARCFHGGAFFEAIGEEFDNLGRSRQVINADVLDAWFPPSPRVLSALGEYFPWLARTSPPTGCEGFVRTVAAVRDIPLECVVPGAGSSDLIYRALRKWLTPRSRVLIPDPTYGEYAFVAREVVGSEVDRLPLNRDDGYRLSAADLAAAASGEYDLLILVNPNNPTGRHIPRSDLAEVLRRIPKNTLVWLDETYVEYAGAAESLEKFASGSENVIVCKSMSKVYALSGLRVAYLCAPPHLAHEVRSVTPPWAVSLPGQVGAVMALKDPAYYEQRYVETRLLRARLAERVRLLDGVGVLEGIANFILCHLPPTGPSAATVCERCRSHGLFLRDLSTLGQRLGSHALRIAVKDRETNERIAAILGMTLRDREIQGESVQAAV